MCGIVGFIDFNKTSTKEILKEMTNFLVHRGPDAEGYFFQDTIDYQIGLGHRRLSILDLSESGHQPMFFENLVIVYNGEVYNFQEIRKELKEYGYTFNSNSDTEVILKAFHKWSLNAIDKFNGMFAIALYDKKNQQLYLIRDRVGVKPLYWYFKSNLFLFSSELKSLYKHPKFEKEIDINGLLLYLQYGYIVVPYTIFQNTYKLKPGHYLEIDLKSKRINQIKYWDIEDFYHKPRLKISEQEAIGETERLLKSAFKYRLIADVPVGLFLSGGYDSSAVAALLQSEMTNKLKTFTIGFYEEKYNEAPFAKKVAKYLETEHYEYYCTQKEALEIIPKLPEIYDEPFGDSSAIPTVLVSNFTRNYVTVSLSADGGDELFCGYPLYKNTYNLYNKFQKIKFLKSMSGILEKIDPFILSKVFKIYNFEGKFYKFLEMLRYSNNPFKFYLSNVKYFYESELSCLLSANILVNELFEYNITKNDFHEMLCFSFKTYLCDDILTKVDRATMSISLEGREPFLDYRVMEFVARLPIEYKQNRDITKYILRKIVHKHIPEEMMDRPKMGFSVPLFEWFRDELKEYFEEYLNENLIKKNGVFNWNYVQKLKQSFYKRNGNPYKLWLILMFQMWWDRWLK